VGNRVGGSGRRADTERLFADPECSWNGVSPALLTVRRLAPGALAVGALVAALVLAVTGARTLLVVPVLALVAAAAWWAWLPRTISAWRYAERADDLLVSRGRIVRRLTIVPYGRMQVIDVEAGPLASRFGIASVKLVTASASTDAEIPGLPVDVAHDLRNRLAARGEARAAGL